MPNSKKLLQAAAGAAGGEALNVEDVFSTYLYTGTGSTQYLAIDDVDVYNEGGLYWSKGRSVGTSLGNGRHFMVAKPSLGSSEIAFYSDATASNAAASTVAEGTWMQSDGTQYVAGSGVNTSGTTYTSWTFRKAPKFFDVVTYTGTSTGQSINHNLGTTPAVIIIKKTSNTGDWVVYHRVDGSSPSRLFLNTTGAGNSTGTSGDSYFTSQHSDTTFSIGANSRVNGSGETYVAYLFAHNDGDGEFGPDGDQDIIKCGSYTGNGSSTGPEIDLGFEPQWLLIKGTSASDSWAVFDVMRGMTVGSSDSYLFPNSSNAELSYSSIVRPTPTGFQLESVNWNTNTNNYIYIAIRRGPMAVPESATDVWDTSVANFSTPAFEPNFNADMVWVKRPSQSFDTIISARLMQGKFNETTSTAGESTGSFYEYDYQDAWGSSAVGSTYRGWSWKRAPKFFDVVSYTGNGSSNTINHNLGVIPEMIVTKKRTGGTASWGVVLKDHNSGLGYLKFNETDVLAATTYNVHPNRTATSYGLNADGLTNNSGHIYIAYLFASLDGISKVGTYTGNGGSQTIDCGFSAGARFVLIKGLDITSSWLMFDTDRGIVAGNDPAIVLNSDQAQITTNDYIDPDNSGFAFDTSNALVNGSGYEYMFYAVA